MQTAVLQIFMANTGYNSPQRMSSERHFVSATERHAKRVTPRRALAVVRYHIIFVNHIFLYSLEKRDTDRTASNIAVLSYS